MRGFPVALRTMAGTSLEVRSGSNLGDRLFLQLPPVALRNTSQYAGAGVIWAKVLSYPCRTNDPAEADLFFVPVLNEHDGVVSYRRGNKGFRNIVCPAGSLWIRKACRRSSLVDFLEAVRDERSNVSYLRRRGGRDHLLYTPREGTLSDSHPYDTAATRPSLCPYQHDRFVSHTARPPDKKLHVDSPPQVPFAPSSRFPVSSPTHHQHATGTQTSTSMIQPGATRPGWLWRKALLSMSGPWRSTSRRPSSTRVIAAYDSSHIKPSHGPIACIALHAHRLLHAHYSSVTTAA